MTPDLNRTIVSEWYKKYVEPWSNIIFNLFNRQVWIMDIIVIIEPEVLLYTFILIYCRLSSISQSWIVTSQPWSLKYLFYRLCMYIFICVLNTLPFSYFKGTVPWDFLFKKWFRQKCPSGPLIHDLKQFQIFTRLSWDIQLPHSESLQWTRLCAMGHCGEFRNALWAAAMNLVKFYGPLRGMKPTVKIRNDFRVMGHSAGFS
jgi:hypothetical protein